LPRKALQHQGILLELQGLFSLELTETQQQRTIKYLDLLQKWGRKINLTSISDPESALRLHFFESFWLAKHFLGPGRKLADIGTGAGFPGLAAKIYQPHLNVTLIEKNLKKRVFLSHVSRLLGLEAKIFTGSAEEFKAWDQIDIVSFRALLPSTQLQVTLRHQTCKLLILHGIENVLPEREFIPLKKSLVPGSRNRFATLFKPHLYQGNTASE
jgi:16S rRNA (guanine527-N7)-methyltransferase